MKKQFIIIASIIIFAIVVVTAVFLYDELAADYYGEDDTTAINSSTQALSETSSDVSEEILDFAPDFTVTDRDGKSVSLSSLKGTPVVINFWATWCGPCRSELPAFNKLYLEYKDRVQFMMLSLTDGARETVKGVNAFIDENKYIFPVYFDTSSLASAAYRVYSIPLTVFINPEGKIVNSHLGSMKESTLKNYIDELLK